MQISATWGAISTGLLLFAWWSARQGNIRRHRLLMIVLTAAAWGFIAAYLSRYRSSGAGPQIPSEYIVWFAIHGSLGLIPLLGATILVCSRLLHGRRKDRRPSHLIRRHHIYGMVFVVLWLFTHVGGIANYWLLR